MMLRSIALGSLILLSGCGQKGALFLPERPQPADHPQSTDHPQPAPSAATPSRKPANDTARQAAASTAPVETATTP